ncbi:MAG: GNAT family N-acetyltransferase [Candidatus Competibacterales bacterium]
MCALTRFWLRLRGRWRALGAGNIPFYLLHRALAPWQPRLAFQRYFFVAQPVTPGHPPLAATANITVRPLASQDWRGEHWTAPIHRDTAEIARRRSLGCDCLEAFRGDQLVGWLWLCYTPYRESEDRCSAIPETPAWAFDLDVYIVPSARLSKALIALWRAANNHLAARHIPWTYSRISAFNPGSLAAHRRLGARVVARACFLRLGRWQLVTASVKPYFHMTGSPLYYPQLWLHPPRHPGGRP